MTGSARLPTSEAYMSLRQTKKLRLTMCRKRSCRRSITDVAPGKLDEDILEVGGARQRAQPGIALHGLEQCRRLLAVTERRLTGQFDALRVMRRDLAGPLLHALAIHLDHVRFNLRVDELARRVLGDHRAMIEDPDAVAQALGLIHEMRGEDQRAARGRQALEPIPDHVPCL